VTDISDEAGITVTYAGGSMRKLVPHELAVHFLRKLDTVSIRGCGG